MSTTLKILMTLFSLSHCAIAKMDYCSPTCDVCLDDMISCRKPEFQQMPSQLSKNIRQIILINQQFISNFLSRDNFSALSPSPISLRELSIRRSNIHIIKSQTFADLKRLKVLDLTYHKDLLIKSRSFDGLNLTFLKLDHNEDLKFEVNAFRGLIVRSLHMSHSSIVDIPYSLLEPILPSLAQLFLDNNHITNIDPRYQVNFKNLNLLNIETNPISCSCAMRWLTEVYLYRRKNGKLNKDAFSDKIEISPSCAEPKHLKGKYLHEVSLAMFLCDPPTLTQLKVDFQSLTHTTLSCSATQNIQEAHMSVEWFTEIIQGFGKKLSTIFSPIENLFPKKIVTESISISKKKSTDSYQCVAKNVNGNTTATVRINWPPTERFSEFNNNIEENTNNGYQKPDDDNYLFQKRFTLLEMIGAVIGTFSITLLIFFLIYKMFFLNRQFHRKSVAPPNGYTTYEAAVYSDSQTYDVPGNAYPQSVLLPMPHLSSTPDHFLDFKTQKMFYQTN